MNKNYGIFVIFVIALIISLFIDFQIAAHKSEKVNNIDQQNIRLNETKIDEIPEVNNEVLPEKRINISGKISIPLNPMIEFSGMNVNDILSMRKDAVNNSKIFSYISDYKPNPEVFQIEDGLQWISAYQISCNGVGQPDIGKGASRESIAILNPELMYYVSILNFEFSKHNMPCSPTDYLIPYKVIYDGDTNTISAYIDFQSLKNKMGYFVNTILSDANTHDLGYNYASAVNSQNIRYKSNINLSNQIIQTRGFYHRGGSCGLPEGCNNYSPYEPAYEFYITELPAIIDIKLWKNYPSSTSEKSDLNYRMIFE